MLGGKGVEKEGGEGWTYQIVGTQLKVKDTKKNASTRGDLREVVSAKIVGRNLGARRVW